MPSKAFKERERTKPCGYCWRRHMDSGGRPDRHDIALGAGADRAPLLAHAPTSPTQRTAREEVQGAGAAVDVESQKVSRGAGGDFLTLNSMPYAYYCVESHAVMSGGTAINLL
jgi:hypothetical protein